MDLINSIVFEGKRRYYIEDLTERDYFLENTTPYLFEYKDYCIKETAWGEMLRSVAHLLLSEQPNKVQDILLFKCQWSKQKMFSLDKGTNYKQVWENLFINCNHTALHACWLLQDLLDYFAVEKNTVKLLIHRPPAAETKETKEVLESHFKNEFIEFLKYGYDKDEEYAQNVLLKIDKYLNPILRSLSKSYTSLFLFDDFTTASSYIYKIKELISHNLTINEKVKNVLMKYLKYLIDYYKL